jgi:L-alanine-DL-glutamate epimerase-like enolase superfamily enzyme
MESPVSRSLVEPRHYLALIAAAFFITLAPHRHPPPAPLAAAHHASSRQAVPAVSTRSPLPTRPSGARP